MDLVNWVVNLYFHEVSLNVYFEELPEDIAETTLYEMALEKIEKDGWTLPPEKLTWETEIW